MKKITKIVITGGPCAGKTSAMKVLKNVFTKKGYTVLFISETATELISGGVAPWTCANNVEYQRCQMYLQIAKENIFHQAALTMSNDRILIVCDRGLIDNKGYMGEKAFHAVLNEMGLTEEKTMYSYDAVFHLATAAKGAEEFYTLSNNAARTETIEEAIAVDDNLMKVWTPHPHFTVVDNSTDFEDKINRLIQEIEKFLGE